MGILKLCLVAPSAVSTDARPFTCPEKVVRSGQAEGTLKTKKAILSRRQSERD